MGIPPLPDCAAGPFELHHIGIAVQDIDRALGYYTSNLGFVQRTEPMEVSSQHVKVCFVEAPPGILIELVEGVGPESPVANHLERVGGGPYHLCFEVADLDAAADELRRQGFFRLRRFQQAVPDTRRFAFMLTPDRQLLELCEAPLSPP